MIRYLWLIWRCPDASTTQLIQANCSKLIEQTIVKQSQLEKLNCENLTFSLIFLNRNIHIWVKLKIKITKHPNPLFYIISIPAEIHICVLLLSDITPVWNQLSLLLCFLKKMACDGWGWVFPGLFCLCVCSLWVVFCFILWLVYSNSKLKA